MPLEHASTVLPAMQTYHVGLIRDEKTLQVCGEQRFSLLPTVGW